MTVEPPSVGAAVAIRLADGHEQVSRVVISAPPCVHVEPELTSSDGETVDVAWVTPMGLGRRGRARLVSHGDRKTVLEIVGVTELAGRFLHRFVPVSPLLAELVVFDDFGQISAELTGSVRDLALTGAGLDVEGLAGGETVLITLAEVGGHAVVSGIEARVAHVETRGGATVAGIVFSSPFDAAPAIAALESGL
jgi:hypothetical protein